MEEKIVMLKQFRRELSEVAEKWLMKLEPEDLDDTPETMIEKRFGALLWEIDEETRRLLYVKKLASQR